MSESATTPSAPVEQPAASAEKSVAIAAPPSTQPSSKSVSAPPPRKNVSLSTLARTDAFLGHLLRAVQTRAGADAVLMFACYSTRLTANLLTLASTAALRSSARRLVSAFFTLPPATTVVLDATTSLPTSVGLAMALAERLQAFSGLVSEMRTMNRLWGLVGLYAALKGLIAKTRAAAAEKNKDALSDESAEKVFSALLAWAQVLSLIAFQACENAAYLGSKKVLPIKPLNQGKLALLSVRFWGAYVGMEVVKHIVERARRLAPAGGVAKTAEDKEWQRGWRKAFYRNAAWAPLTMHWGTPGGLLPDVVVSLLATYPATGGVRDLWRSTA